MKKLILSFVLIIGLNAAVQAQNWKFTLYGTTTDITNTTLNQGVFNTDLDTINFYATNMTTGILDAYVTRKIITQPGIGWSEQVCFGSGSNGYCVDLDSTDLEWTPTEAVPVAADSSGLVNIKIKPIPSQAPALYRYYIGVQGDLYQDSLDVAYYSTVSVNEIEKEAVLTVSPNPASNYVNIQVSNFEKGNLKIVDVLGNTIKNTPFNGSIKLNTAEYRNGIYFIMVSGEGVRTINRKLVVRH